MTMLAPLHVGAAPVDSNVDTNIFGAQNGSQIVSSSHFGDNAGDISANLTKEVMEWFLYICSAAAIYMIIYAGARLIQAGGDQDQAQEAKRSIVYIVLGIIVLVSSLTIISVSANTANFIAQVPNVQL